MTSGLRLPSSQHQPSTGRRLGRRAPRLASCSRASSAKTSAPASAKKTSAPALPTGDYDPDLSAAYFAARPLTVVRRLAFLVSRASTFGVGLALDRRLGIDASASRAAELRVLLTELGPTAVKIGQALSIRVDLLTPPYLEELQKLQDQVPAFGDDVAQSIVDSELAASGSSLQLPASGPVAAASLGQVYKVTLDDNRQVAVKVQRPEVREGILLDLHLLRLAAPIIKSSQNLNSDLEALVDEWGFRFVSELDYLQEAKNGTEFQAAMRARALLNITTPTVVDNLTTSKVLVTEWIEGVRLEESDADDVSRLCGVALNAYLTMLLDTGTLHADPHPGNLLRTNDGRLCILDWGLVTPVSEERQYALIEYIAHLVSEDYSSIPSDLVALGFVPPGSERVVEELGVVRVLSAVLAQLSAGGGAASINFDALIGELSAMTSTYGNLFQIPPYFAYILRSFAVLEGIGLQADPSYAIVQECYPYLARRLFTDDSPRAQAALSKMIYDTSGEQLNARRLVRLGRAFQDYNASTMRAPPSQTSTDSPRSTATVPAASETSPSPASSSSLSIDPTQREVLMIIFSEKGNYLQSVVIRETARAIDALSRDAFMRFVQSTGGRLALEAASRQRAAAAALGPLRPVLLPLPLPGEIFQSVQPLASKDAEDDAVLATLAELTNLAGPTIEKELGLSRGQVTPRQVSTFFSALPPELTPGVRVTLQRLSTAIVERVVARLRNQPAGNTLADAVLSLPFLPKPSSTAATPALQSTAVPAFAASQAKDVVVTWTDEAQRELNRAPGFVRAAARNKAEAYAKEQGLSTVDMNVVRASR
mmetsp:Transcript_30647/g.99664  ORF Transcript_30647/g.99664 Transcript_30647/m.99664 type:complete len:823 (-) Transcript_30647:51-2519(-)|eukprot:CAMPEP_0170144398 /NCGR_PEP_ID=MMETSP0033_2-20121228/13458_1 /TAXON_ID=195969 /ORGANISM="Dolichomastix tenuilepis, Strain CCMP3274" /LENGTH=822 /DNA_ID=CAMNT_0010380895 /DNA_START=183 /DNA_END=2651 /DNA_ORIENTATION=-